MRTFLLLVMLLVCGCADVYEPSYPTSVDERIRELNRQHRQEIDELRSHWQGEVVDRGYGHITPWGFEWGPGGPVPPMQYAARLGNQHRYAIPWYAEDDLGDQWRRELRKIEERRNAETAPPCPETTP